MLKEHCSDCPKGNVITIKCECQISQLLNQKHFKKIQNFYSKCFFLHFEFKIRVKIKRMRLLFFLHFTKYSIDSRYLQLIGLFRKEKINKNIFYTLIYNKFWNTWDKVYCYWSMHVMLFIEKGFSGKIL